MLRASSSPTRSISAAPFPWCHRRQCADRRRPGGLRARLADVGTGADRKRRPAAADPGPPSRGASGGGGAACRRSVADLPELRAEDLRLALRALGRITAASAWRTSSTRCSRGSASASSGFSRLLDDCPGIFGQLPWLPVNAIPHGGGRYGQDCPGHRAFAAMRRKWGRSESGHFSGWADGAAEPLGGAGHRHRGTLHRRTLARAPRSRALRPIKSSCNALATSQDLASSTAGPRTGPSASLPNKPHSSPAPAGK